MQTLQAFDAFKAIEEHKEDLTKQLSELFCSSLQKQFSFLTTDEISEYAALMASMALVYNSNYSSEQDLEQRLTPFSKRVQQMHLNLFSRFSGEQIVRQRDAVEALFDQGNDLIAAFCNKQLMESVSSFFEPSEPGSIVMGVEMGIVGKNGVMEIVHSDFIEPNINKQNLH